MRNTLLSAVAITAAFAFTAAAHASTYTLTISGSDTGLLTVTGTQPGGDPGSILLSSGYGTLDGYSVTLVPAPSGYSLTNNYIDPVSGFSFDDELYAPPQAPPIDAAGLEFTNGSGLFLVPYADPVFGYGVYQLDPTTNFVSDSSGDSFTAALAPAVTATPEPSSVMLLGTGLLGLAGVARRKLFGNA